MRRRYFDPAAGADALAAELEAAPRRRRACGPSSPRAGAEQAAGFSWERAARETMAVYRELL